MLDILTPNVFLVSQAASLSTLLKPPTQLTVTKIWLGKRTRALTQTQQNITELNIPYFEHLETKQTPVHDYTHV